jgi:hypothetical membrane protein
MPKIRTFHNRYPYVGPVFWMLSVQYYVVQVVVASAWQVPFSLRFNTISDLGNTACGQYGQRIVCSPLHADMNGSFIALGVSMMIGSLLIYNEFKESRATAFGFGAMAAAGFGTLLVGLFPENTVSALHILGAGLPFFVGNVGLVVLGLKLPVPKPLRLYTLVSGAVMLIALALFVAGVYLGLGIGGMERVVAYPQTIWLIVFGMYLGKKHLNSAN